MGKDPDEVVDEDRLVQSFARAWERRSEFHRQAKECEAYRLMEGRYEGAPGWAVDRYGSCVLIQCFQREGAAESLLARLVLALQDRLGSTTPIFLKERKHPDRASREDGSRQLAGSSPPVAHDDPMSDRFGRLVVTEWGMRFGVDLCYGQNTGLFADSRPARLWVRKNSSGLRILNLFSYTAAFGVAASCGGARSVTNVDGVRSAVERGRVNYALNQLPQDTRTHLKSDVFDFLRLAARRSEAWDGIILDPPPRATKGRTRGFDPRRDTSKLLERALGVCAQGGWILGLSSARSPTLFDLASDKGAWEFLPLAVDLALYEGQGRRAAVLHPR